MSELELQIVSPAEFDVSKITATEPRKKNERLQSILLYNGSPFYLETEWGRAPFGVTTFDGEKTDNYSVNISLTPDGDFVKNLLALDEKMIDFGIEHSMAIFKRKYNPNQRDVVRAMFTSSVKLDEKGEYPPRIAPKIQKKSVSDSSPQLLFYHSETEEVDIETYDQLTKLVTKGSKIKALVSLRPWFISGRFGVAYTIQQILVPKRSGGRPTTYAFNDKTGAVATKISAEKAASSIKGDDEDDDIDNVDVAEAEDHHTDPESVEDSDVVEAAEAEDEEEEDKPPSPKKNVKKAPTPAPTTAATSSKQKPRQVPATTKK